MRECSLLCKVLRAVGTTRRATTWPTTPNLIRGRSPTTGPDQVWVAHLTSIHLRHATGFLACILDAWSRRCVGWAFDPDLTTDLTERALAQAITLRQPTPGLIHHSDQGVQYANHRYAAALSRIGAVASISAAGRPMQNAHIESFFATLKREEVTINDYLDLADAKLHIGSYIDQIYNSERLHSKLGYRPPIEFELTTAMAS